MPTLTCRFHREKGVRLVEGCLAGVWKVGGRKFSAGCLPSGTERRKHVFNAPVAHSSRCPSDKLVARVAMGQLAYIFGLQESSLLHIRVEDVQKVSGNECQLQIRKLKGRTEAEALRAGPRTYYRPGKVSFNPLDVIEAHMRRFRLVPGFCSRRRPTTRLLDPLSGRHKY